MEKINNYVEVRCIFGGPDPGKPKPGEMQVFCEGDAPVMVDFLCPCGCGNTCPTHLVPPGAEKKPADRRWNFSRGPNGPTLSPSIRWLSECKSHFTITDGKVQMH